MLLLVGCIGGGGPLSPDDSASDSVVADPEPMDTVIVLDNSASMQDETAALVLAAQNMSAREGQSWAVMTVDGDKGGVFMREPSSDPDDVVASLACDAGCWSPSELPSDPDHECGTPAEVISLQVLDCICGLDTWEGHCGSGDEEPLESIYGALCRSGEDCADFESQAGLLREGVVTHFAVFTDEGDSSRGLSPGEDDPGAYLAMMDSTARSYRISVMGPDYDPDAGTMSCNSGGATTWGVARLQAAVDHSGGSYEPITVGSSECEQADVAAFLEAL